MDIIDMRTIVIMSVFTNLISALFLGFLWYQNRNRFPSLRYWVLDIGLQTMAVFLISLRGFIPDWISIFIGTSLVIVGAIAGYLGTAYFFRQKPRLRLNIFFLVCFVLIHGTFLFITPSLAIRNLNLAFFFMLICLESFLLLGRNIDRTVFASTGFLRISFALLTAVNAIRVLEYFITPNIKSDYFDSGSFDKLVLITYLMLTLLLVNSIILLVNKRLTIELQNQHQKILNIAKRDPLTNVYNRKYIANQLQLLVDAYVQSDRCVAVAILDLDYFKNVNDTYGHFAGDATLIEFTQVIQANIRDTDLIGRQGGEEFIIVAADTGKEDLKQMIDRILEIVRAQPVHYHDFVIPYTFSGGVSDCQDFPRATISVEKLVVKADDRMYLAKDNGRNQVFAHDRLGVYQTTKLTDGTFFTASDSQQSCNNSLQPQ